MNLSKHYITNILHLKSYHHSFLKPSSKVQSSKFSTWSYTRTLKVQSNWIYL